MTKQDIANIFRSLSERYPKYYKKMNKQEQIKYMQDMYELFNKYDLRLLEDALNGILVKRYPNPPSFIQLLTGVSRALFDRRSEVFIKMYDNKYYHKGLTGTEEEIDRKAFEIWDRIAIEFLKDRITNTHQKEIIDAVNEYDYLKEYKGLILFDESLPIPPGCDPNKSWDFSTPTCHLHSHKY